eukprot:gene21147-23224_t
MLSKRSRRTFLNPAEIAKLWIRKHQDQDGLDKKFIDESIGWGVIAKKTFEKGSFLLEYIGDTVSRKEGEIREKKYEKAKLGYYLYFFSSKGKELWQSLNLFLYLGFPGRQQNIQELSISTPLHHHEISAASDIQDFTQPLSPVINPILVMKAAHREKMGSKDMIIADNVPDNDSWYLDRDKSCPAQCKKEFWFLPILKFSDINTSVENVNEKKLFASDNVNQITNDNGVGSENPNYYAFDESEEIESVDLHNDSGINGDFNQVIETDEMTDDNEEETSPMEWLSNINSAETCRDEFERVNDNQTAGSFVVMPSVTEDIIKGKERKPVESSDDDDVYNDPSYEADDVQSSTDSDSDSSDSSGSDVSDTDDLSIGKSKKKSSKRVSSSIQSRKTQSCESIRSTSDTQQARPEVLPTVQSSVKPKVTVPLFKKNEHGGRVYDKAHNCFFCDKECLKIARLLLTVHKDEEDVLKIIAIDEKTKEGKVRRQKELERLRLKGDFRHNSKVLKCGGELKVLRRPMTSDLADYRQFTPCTHCLGFVQRHELWRHVAQCDFNNHKKDPDAEEHVANRRLQHESEMLLYGSQEFCSQAMQDSVLSSMRPDEISFVAKRDDLIILFGSSWFEKSGSSRVNHISDKMRSLARLLIKLRELPGKEEADLADFIKPRMFDSVVNATKDLCIFTQSAENDHISTFNKPGLALKIGHALTRCAELLRGLALRQSNKDMKEDVDSFIQLISSEWSAKVSSAALRKLGDNAFKKSPHMPKTEDLVKLRDHLLKEIPLTTKAVLSEPSLTNWRKLAELTVARILLFNKRRGNEGSKVELKQFEERPKWLDLSMEEMSRSLQPLEMELCKRIDLVYIRGKRGQKVPILMDKAVVAAIEALIKQRNAVGVSAENKYIFAAPTRGSKKYLRGPDCLASVIGQCDLMSPNLIKSTKLRKYIATVSQIIDLNSSELEWLANHMGHDISVHREYYRLHDSTLELSKVSRLLLAVDEGSAAKWQGKRLSDIDLNEIPVEADEEDDEGGEGDRAAVDVDIEEEDVESVTEQEPSQAATNSFESSKKSQGSKSADQ